MRIWKWRIDIVGFEDSEDLMIIRRLYLVVFGFKGRSYVIIWNSGFIEVRIQVDRKVVGLYFCDFMKNVRRFLFQENLKEKYYRF